MSGIMISLMLTAGCNGMSVPDTHRESTTGALQETQDSALQEDDTLREDNILQETEEGSLSENQAPPSQEPVADLPKEQSEYYAYNCLNENEKIWYADIYSILAGHLDEGALNGELIGILQNSDVDKIFQCVLNDHPELFYITGYSLVTHTRNDEVEKLVFQGNYSMDAGEAAIRKEQIELEVSKCLEGISPDAGEYEKVKYVYEYVVENTEYRLEAPENQNVCSVFIGRESVCQGYAKAVQYLLNRMDVFCTLVIGTVEGGMGHAWNLVRVDGEYYYVDGTWGDASYRSDGDSGTVHSSVNYDYLCVTTEQLCKTHVIENIVPMPECNSMEANYYVREGKYFTAYDESAVKAFLGQARAEGLYTVTMKCADLAVYNAFLTELITNQKIFEFIDVPGGILRYSDDSKQLSLTVWITEE